MPWDYANYPSLSKPRILHVLVHLKRSEIIKPRIKWPLNVSSVAALIFGILNVILVFFSPFQTLALYAVYKIKMKSTLFGITSSFFRRASWILKNLRSSASLLSQGIRSPLWLLILLNGGEYFEKGDVWGVSRAWGKGRKEKGGRGEGQEGVCMAINQNYGNAATYALVFYVY